MSLTKYSFSAVLLALALLASTPLVVRGDAVSLQNIIFSDMHNVVNVTSSLTLTYDRQAFHYSPSSATDPLPDTVGFIEGLSYFMGSDGTAWVFDAPDKDGQTFVIKLRIKATGPWIAIRWSLSSSSDEYVYINLYSGGYQLYSYSASEVRSGTANMTVSYVDPNTFLELEIILKRSGSSTLSNVKFRISAFDMFDKLVVNNNYAHGVVVYDGSSYGVVGAGSSTTMPLNPNIMVYTSYLTVKTRDLSMTETDEAVDSARIYNLYISAPLGNFTAPKTIYPEDLPQYTTLLEYAAEGKLWIDGCVNGTYYTARFDPATLEAWLTVYTYANETIPIGKPSYYELTDSYGNVLSSGASASSSLKVPRPPGFDTYLYIYDYGTGVISAYVVGSGGGESAVTVNLPPPAESASWNASINPWWTSITIPYEVVNVLQLSPLVSLGLAAFFLLISGRQFAGVGCALSAMVLAVSYLVGELQSASYILPMAAVPVAFGFWEEVKRS